jgi:hypothetical protein
MLIATTQASEAHQTGLMATIQVITGVIDWAA